MKKIQNNEYKKYRLYGMIGMVAVFFMGALVGFILNGSDRINHSIMTKSQCERLTDKMSDAIYNNNYEAIGQLNKIYSENCLDRVFDEPKLQQETKHQMVRDKKILKETCGKIEETLEPTLLCADDSCYGSDNHVHDAKVYATLAEKGCFSNREKYKELAKQELEIARALNDDNIQRDPKESVEIVETYKRLQMQAEAERMIEKAKKLTNPAIDFIIQLEKIIEE